MNNEFVTLSDEELEMVAGGSISQSASASASSAQSATLSLKNISADADASATAKGYKNVAAAESQNDIGNVVQTASNTAIAVNAVKSRVLNTYTF